MPGCLHAKRQVRKIDAKDKMTISKCLECGATLVSLHSDTTPGEGIADWMEAHGQRTLRRYGVPITH